jgi:hypothetical protein
MYSLYCLPLGRDMDLGYTTLLPTPSLANWLAPDTATQRDGSRCAA